MVNPFITKLFFDMRLLFTLFTIIFSISLSNAQKFIDLEPNHHRELLELTPKFDVAELGVLQVINSLDVTHSPSIIYVDLNATGSKNGSSWDNAFINLQTAMDSASYGDQIWIAKGVYTPEIIDLPQDSNFFRISKTVELYGGFEGNETTLDQRDWSTNTTILSGDINEDDIDDNFEDNKDDNTMHVVAALAENIIIDGIQLSYGKSRIVTDPSLINSHAYYGAGLISAFPIALKNCYFKQNYASWGGAIYFYPSMNYIQIDSTRFENNLSELAAGAINIGNSNAQINTCIFDNNKSKLRTGGAIFCWQNTSSQFDTTAVQISHCTFTKNQGNIGGAITYNNFTNGTYFEIDNCTFHQNKSLNESFGGALSILNSPSSQSTKLSQINSKISNSSFTANSAKWGSALMFDQSSNLADLLFVNNTIENNTNTSGSTVFIRCNYESDLTVNIDSSHFEANSSDFQTGALYLLNNQMKSGLRFEINNSQFLENDGGLYVGAINCNSLSGGDGSNGRISHCQFTKNKAELSCGAISSINGNTIISDCSFTENETSNSASAICFTTLEKGKGLATLKNSEFVGNRSTVGLDTSDIWLNNGTIEIWSEGQQNIEIDQCNFMSNKSIGVGGAITLINQEELNANISHCNFTENEAETTGGAIASLAYNSFDPLPNITLESNRFLKNVSMINAGAVHLSKTNATVNNCDFIQNSNLSNSSIGGALNISNGGAFIVSKCNFKENISKGTAGAFCIYQNQSLHDQFRTNVNVTRCTFEDNSSTQSGGAMSYLNYNNESFVNVDSSNFFSNKSNSGGGIYTLTNSQNNDKIKSNLTIQNSRFNNNSALNIGGAIYNSLQKDTIIFTVNNCVFDANQALRDNAGTGGGAILNAGESSTGKLLYSISNSQFTNNYSVGISGGIWNTSTTSLQNGPRGIIKNCSFTNNRAKYCCGGLGAALDECIIDNCIFEDNETNALHPSLPGGGGAGFVINKDLSISNSIFKNNSSKAKGSALIIESMDKGQLENLLIQDHEGANAIYVNSPLEVKNLSFINNNVGLNTGVQTDLSLQNTLFDNKINYQGSGKVSSLGGNLSSDESMTTFLIGNGEFKDFNNTNPLLDQSFIPTETSPCVDGGNHNDIVQTKDLNGNNRIQGNTIDIGAYESPFTTSYANVIWDAEKLSIYPNPSHDYILLQKATEFKMNYISIYDHLGNLKIQKSLNASPNSNNIKISIDKLSQGEYFLIAKGNTESYVQKFIKK